MSKSVESRIESRLRGFVETLKSKDARLTEQFTCRTVELNLPTIHFTPQMVSDVRGVLGVSQSLFARFLGVSVNAVRTWEQGTKTPQGVAQRFMDEMRRDPDYWRARLQESVKIRERA